MNKKTSKAPSQVRDRIAALNDELRANIHCPRDNPVVMTAGIVAMMGDRAKWPAPSRHADLLRLVRDYDQFDEINNPHGERDFGDFEWQGVRCYWKIDYYDRQLAYGSKDPADPEQTRRVLTILRADEY